MFIKHLSRLSFYSLFLFGVVVTEVGCFKKQTDSEKIFLKDALSVKAVYNNDDPTQSYLELSGDCGVFGGILITYSSEYTSSTEVRADCSGGSQNKKKATVTKKLTIQNGEKSQVFNVTQVAIYKSQKTNAVKTTVRYSPSPPARAGFAIVSGGVVWDSTVNNGASGFATFGEPFGAFGSPLSVQTGGTMKSYTGLFNVIYQD